MPVIPGQGNAPVDLIDSELAAKIIRKIATSQPNPGAIYHAAAGKHAVLLRDLCGFCTEQMHDDVRDDGWTLDHHQHSRQHTRMAKAWLPVLLASRIYDTTQAENLWGGPLPLAPWRKHLRRC